MKKISDTAVTFALCCIIAALIAFSPLAKDGAKEGLSMCESIIIPSLLPVLIISNIIVKSRCSIVFEKLFGRAFEKLLRLPRCSAAAVILGLTAGYPSGAILTSSLYENGLINEKEACRIMRFNLCGGVAFIITAVGGASLGSVKAGIILYLICLISSILTAFISGFFEKGVLNTKSVSFDGLSVFEALPPAAESAVKSIALMSAYIVLFSAFSAVINPPLHLAPLIEITNGIFSPQTDIPLPYCAFFLTFGGLCIHFQLFGLLKQMHINYLDFLVHRMLNALIAFGLAKLYIHLFPQYSEVFSNLSEAPKHYFTNGGIALSLVMLVGCAVIIFDIENRKLKSA